MKYEPNFSDNLNEDYPDYSFAPVVRAMPRNFFIKRSEIAARIVGLCDPDRKMRENWIKSWVSSEDSHSYISENFRILSQVYIPFDALVLHGECIDTISEIVRLWRAAIRAKPVIVVMSNVNPRIRTGILMAGADAVFDIAVDPEEAAAQLRAIARPVARGCDRAMPGGAPMSRMISDHLTKAEQDILNVFWKRKGRSADYYFIISHLNLKYSEKSVRNLQLMIHNIRKKIPDFVEIRNIRGFGYEVDFNKNS